MRGISVVATVVLACVGCSHLDLDVASDQPEWGESYVAAEKSPARLRSERIARVLVAARAQPPREAQDYVVGASDVLQIGVFALEEPGTTTTLTCTVGHDGKIALPWVESVRVQGLTARQAAEAVRAAYDGKYLKNPQVTVTVAEHHSSVMIVTGAVNKPGVYPLKYNTSTVLGVLALAGGPTREAGDEVLLLRGGDEVIPIDLTELIDAGNLALNLQVGDGDILTVPPQVKQYIYVLGYVRRPGVYRLENSTRVDALRAVAFGGGLTGMSRAENSYLVRETPGGTETIPVDITKIAAGDLPPLYLRPGDALIVGTSAWQQMTAFMRPGMAANLSASASVVP